MKMLEQMKKNLVRRAAVCGAVALVPTVTLAAGPQTEVLVTATRVPKPLENVPAAVGVVYRDDIQLARQQIGLDESLVQVPGLFLQNRYNFAQDLRVSIRGFGARANFGIRGIRIFVDGIPETLPDGQGGVDSIDLGSVEQITVLRGAASALYGNASGGVILIDSEEAPEQAVVEARTSLGELGYGKHQLKFAGSVGDLGLMVSLSDIEMEGYRDQSELKSRQVNATARYRIDDSSSLRVAFNYTDQPTSDDPGALTRAEVQQNPRQAAPGNLLFDGGESVEQTRLGFVYEKSFGERHSISARNYYIWRDFTNTLPFRAGGAVTIDRFFVGGGVTYTNTGTIGGLGNRLMLGVDYDYQDDDRRRYDNVFGVLGDLTFQQDEKVSSTGIFLQDELQLRENLELTVGLRYDRVKFDVDDRFLSDGDESGSRTLDEVSPLVGLMYRVSPRMNLYANVATSFETPTTTEFANPTGGGGFNRDLDPQIATNYEVGVKGTIGENSTYGLALFRIDVEDELIPFEIPGFSGRSYYVNAGESRRKGIELEFATRPLEGLNIALAYTYSDFEFTRFVDANGNDFSGNAIPGLPDHVLFGEITYRHPRGLFAGFDAVYVDRVFVDNANSETSESYTLANLRVGYTADRGSWRWSAFGGVNNLFDEAYNSNVRINAAGGRYFEPGPRANAYAGLGFEYRFGS